MKKLFALTIISAGALATSACMNNAETAKALPPGEYEKTNASVNSTGTKTETTTKTTVGYDSQGNKKAVVESQTTQDPKGLFNKTTTSKTKQVSN